MPIGYVTANQGESRYTVAIPRRTPLLAALIEARKVEIEGIDRVLEELRKHESDRRAVYDQAMVVVDEAMAGYTECRESYTEPQCRTDKIAAANSAYSAARNACDDTWRDCRFACDIGDGDCQEACDDSRDACELVAETARDRALAAVDRLCVDEVVAHLAACQKEWAPIIASAQAAATEALAPLQDAMIAITWEKTKRTSAVRRLNELEAIESSAEMATCWSAQYNEEIPVGELPDEPTGTEENAVTVATVSGRAIITEIVSVNPCAHDARALPADVLFVDAALAPGAETWRPTWRTGTVTAVNPDGTLKVRINPAILPGTLGTRVSRNNINCTPPGAFFDEDGELDARLGIARQAYDDALQDLADVRAEIQACKDGYTVQACTEPRNEVCEYNREQSMMACIDNRDYCLSIAQDANGEQYCLDQFDACEQQVEAIFSACVDGATADCIEAKRQHDSRCERDRQFDLSQAETAVSTAQRNLINASADIQGPPAELILDVEVAHCFADGYEIGDDVLIDFPARATSTGLDWSTATSEQIRATAMAVWQSARVVGWASETRRCGLLRYSTQGDVFNLALDATKTATTSPAYSGYWVDHRKPSSTVLTWFGSKAYINDAVAANAGAAIAAAAIGSTGGVPSVLVAYLMKNDIRIDSFPRNGGDPETLRISPYPPDLPEAGRWLDFSLDGKKIALCASPTSQSNGVVYEYDIEDGSWEAIADDPLPTTAAEMEQYVTSVSEGGSSVTNYSYTDTAVADFRIILGAHYDDNNTLIVDEVMLGFNIVNQSSVVTTGGAVDAFEVGCNTTNRNESGTSTAIVTVTEPGGFDPVVLRDYRVSSGVHQWDYSCWDWVGGSWVQVSTDFGTTYSGDRSRKRTLYRRPQYRSGPRDVSCIGPSWELQGTFEPFDWIENELVPAAGTTVNVRGELFAEDATAQTNPPDIHSEKQLYASAAWLLVYLRAHLGEILETGVGTAIAAHHPATCVQVSIPDGDDTAYRMWVGDNAVDESNQVFALTPV